MFIVPLRRVGLVAALLASLGAPSSVAAQRSLDSLTALWSQKKYEQVIKPLIAMQDSVRGATLIRVQYMIATSLCRSGRANYRAKGLEFFDALIQQYGPRLDSSFLKSVRTQRHRCAEAHADGADESVPALPASYFPVSSAPEVSISGGKSGYFACPGETQQGRGEFRLVSSAGTIDLSGRVFPLDSAVQARAHVLQLLRAVPGDDVFVADTAGQFVVATLSSAPPSTRRDAGDLLTRQMAFFHDQFGMWRPDSVITLYLVPTEATMRRLSASLHGLTPPNQALGYSVLTDLSMVIRTTGGVGSALHENSHLMLKLNYPDAAPWFDEGLASLYEQSRFEGDQLVGIPNWRGQVLTEFGYPSGASITLGQLMSMSYAQFHEKSELQQTLHYALARYFVLYVQDQGKLPALYHALRPPRAIDLEGAANEVVIRWRAPGTDLATAATVLGTKPAELEQAFRAWLPSVLPASRQCH
jgi:hypothetical protein